MKTGKWHKIYKKFFSNLSWYTQATILLVNKKGYSIIQLKSIDNYKVVYCINMEKCSYNKLSKLIEFYINGDGYYYFLNIR